MKTKNTLCNIKYFVYYSILGFLFESLINILLRNKNKSGISYGPFTCIYFFGYLLVCLTNSITKNIRNPKLKILMFFYIFIIISTIFEDYAGVIIHKITNKDPWDYRKWPFNIDKYISIPSSIGWGIGATIFNYKFKNITNKYIKSFNNELTLLLFGFILYDYYNLLKNR